MADASSFAATPRKRILAAFLDFLLIGLAALLLYALADVSGQQLSFELLAAVAYLAYHGAFLHLWSGQSPGRRTFDITVVSAVGGDLKLGQAVMRSAIRPGMVVAVAVPVFYANRAPAVPRYSARDAEFGYPPQRPKRGE